MHRLRISWALLLFLLAVSPPAAAAGIDQVRLSAAAFDPAGGAEVTLSYELSAAGRVTVQVWDPDGGLVRTLAERTARAAGRHDETWDGKDFSGQVVPDEAYIFTVETAAGEVWDPTTTSGGIVGDVTDARFSRDDGTVTYRLPAASRVLIRLGIESGPMHKTLVDWKPRTGGTVTEYWDGRDESGLVMLQEAPGFTALITYVTLPEGTVIAYGNRERSYREARLGSWADRPQRPRRPWQGPRDRLRPEGLVPPAWARAPRLAMTFPQRPEEREGAPAVSGAVQVRIDADAADRDLLAEDQFEILFFVDNVFFAEAERGHLPFTWRWELDQLPPGEHLLTVNVSSFKGQVGVVSRKVRVAGGGR